MRGGTPITKCETIQLDMSGQTCHGLDNTNLMLLELCTRESYVPPMEPDDSLAYKPCLLPINLKQNALIRDTNVAWRMIRTKHKRDNTTISKHTPILQNQVMTIPHIMNGERKD